MEHQEFDLKLFDAALSDLDGLDDLDVFEIVEKDDWTQDYKYQQRANVYRHKPTGRFVCVNETRSGSPFSDWDYIDPELFEVFAVTATITRTTYTTKKPQ